MENEKKKNSPAKEALSWFITIAIALLLALAVNKFVIVNASIPTGSMQKTLMVGDRVIGWRFAYTFGKSPQRGDIIIFRFPDNEKEMYIKRVIGMPGEKLEIIDGMVYINDAALPLEENYIDKQSFDVRSFGPYYIPDDSYFVMGDNRIDSGDSRVWNNTFVHEDKILGKAVFRLFPNTGGIK